MGRCAGRARAPGASAAATRSRRAASIRPETRAALLKPPCGRRVFPLMADTFETNPTSPLYRALPVLELADAPPEVILDALPGGTRPDPPLEVLPGDVPPLRNPVLAGLRL